MQQADGSVNFWSDKAQFRGRLRHTVEQETARDGLDAAGSRARDR